MQETQTALGFTRTPSEDDPRRDPQLLVALEQIAPGTLLRQAIDDIIRSREGALIVVGEPDRRAARDVPAATRAGPAAADGARVPERGCPRRRARRPPARRDDDADGSRDPARLRRARGGGPLDPHAALGADRRRAGRADG